MAYDEIGTNGNDVLNRSVDSGPGTIVGLAGDDSIDLLVRARLTTLLFARIEAELAGMQQLI